MEKIEFTLPENACEVKIELTANLVDLLLGLTLATLLHQLINVVARFVSISPLFETE